MDEDLSVKAPVTRLRRRMSMEAEDSPLPTTPSTPTKKRSTRLAAKSQLELIDEVATENVPKKTPRKAVAKENLEADSNTGTPTPSLTPSRRNTRIRSNTSILLETTTQNVESPRTKRALRRNSQLGSDTESAITPARQTRRTRKDSTTSVDKQVGDENVVVKIAASTNPEPSTEDPVKSTPVKVSEAGTGDQSPLKRKSPRLQNKTSDCVVKIVKVDTKTTQASPTNKNNTIEKKDTAIPVVNKAEIEILSTSDTKLDDEIKSKNKTDSGLNSSSATEKIAMDLKNKKNRTKSWTTLSSPASKSGFISENEVKLKSKTPNTSLSGSGDGLPSSDENKNLNEPNIKSPNKSLNASKSAKVNTVENKDLAFQVVFDELESQKSDTVKLFENSPKNQQPIVLIEDSDSCSGKLTMDIQIEGEDQCVPVVIDQSINKSPSKCEQSVEAMEIDESVPLNVTIDDFSDKSNTSKEDLEVADKKKSSVSEESMLKNESIEKSKRKSSISIQTVTENKNYSINKSKNDFSDKFNTSKEAVEVADKRKSSVSDKSMLKNESIENSKRKSSISIQTVQENKNDSINKSINSSILSIGNTSTSIQEKINNSSKEKPNRSSLVTQVADLFDLNESRKLDTISQKKVSISTSGENNEKLTKRKSSVSQNNSAIDQDVHESRKSLSNTQTKLSTSIGESNAVQLNESSSKSKRTSSISQTNLEINQNPIVDENNDSQNLKSKRSSLISQTGSHNLEQTENENKSTLIISQLKDVSTSINNAMSPNATVNELSKSRNDPDVKNKSIDKKKNTLSYLTSTPIQQKPLQKLAMQINTSIISPGAENKNEKTLKKDIPKQSHDSDSLSETDDEIKFKSNVKDRVVALNKYSRAQSSSESTEDEPNTKSKIPIKRAVKNSQNKKVPPLESSDSDEESNSRSHKDNKLTPNKEFSQSGSVKKLVKKVQALESSDSDELDSESHQSNKKTPNKNNDSESKPIVKKVNKNSSADISNDSDLDEEVSYDKSKMVDDEASEASDDYESGDSQSEENKRYEAENEIVEKGETLDSEEELSNDSEYEKDSFLVSSDAEDNEILSGTGDDLSMSDNELTMSAKSKKKFNERKLKQQKKASKEMYEARHQGQESAKSKKNRLRLESSTLESENEITQPKKSNRQRINSSQDDGKSMEKSDAEESIVIKKKKSKRLSESIHDITTNEKEITILNQSNIEKNDPLTVAIKQELKTPQKHFNMSIVAINDKIEEVQIDSNASPIRQNETIDPLHATIIEHDIEDSSSSENVEIIQNYDSILNSLNTQTMKIKTVDTSLNLNKKSKSSKNPVIDQLNLTQTKKLKKNKNKTTEDKSFGTLKPKAKETSKIDLSNEEFSDSIDMKLLFSEDSNDSEINASQLKPVLDKEPEEYFIPLKRTEGQTNIPGNIDLNTSALNSSKKNKKRKSSHCDHNEVPTNDTEEPEDSNIKIFIDTKGTHEQSDTSMVVSNSSKKKKNKKNMFQNEDSQVLESPIEIDCTDGITETPVEISFSSDKKKKKNKSINLDVSVNNADIAITESHSEKKSKKKLDSIPQFIETVNENMENTVIEEMPANISIKSEKKKKNKNDVSLNIEPAEGMNSAKKNKKSSTSLVDDVLDTQNTETEDIPAETSLKSDKKKKKKKNKQNIDVSQITDAGEDSDGAPVEMSYKSEKKSDGTDPVTDETLTSSGKKKHKKNKKKKQNKNLSQSMENYDDNVMAAEQDGNVLTERKRKASGNSTIETENESVQNLPSGHGQKKRKIHLDAECIAAYNDTELRNSEEVSLKKSKKNKKSKNRDNECSKQDDVQKHISKKRKYRDSDNEEQAHKVSKSDSFDKIHVPKLPESVINQLTEKPQNKVTQNKRNKKKTSSTVIATMPFVVEEAQRRRNKPSNYLEQSIYLNDSPVKTKQKRAIDKPKVLPFIPTALTSDSGYTSKFNINVLPGQTQFVAQSSNAVNFRESFLGDQRIKKLGTFERCKRHRSHKIAKF